MIVISKQYNKSCLYNNSYYTIERVLTTEGMNIMKSHDYPSHFLNDQKMIGLSSLDNEFMQGLVNNDIDDKFHRYELNISINENIYFKDVFKSIDNCNEIIDKFYTALANNDSIFYFDDGLIIKKEKEK